MAQIHILVAPSPRLALSCLMVEIAAWTRQEITTADLAARVRRAVKHRVSLDTINRLLSDVGLLWNTTAGDFESCAELNDGTVSGSASTGHFGPVSGTSPSEAPTTEQQRDQARVGHGSRLPCVRPHVGAFDATDRERRRSLILSSAAFGLLLFLASVPARVVTGRVWKLVG
jgi:hypothetical protein